MTLFAFALLFLMNAIATRDFVAETASFPIGGQRANVLDVLLGLAVLVTLPRTLFGSSAEHSRPYLWSLLLLSLAVLGGGLMMYIYLEPVPPRWKYAPARNLLTVVLALYVGYHAVRSISQHKVFVWIVLAGSVGSALTSILYGQSTTADMAAGVGNLETLRESALQISFDAGQIAACLVVFSLASRVMLLPLIPSLLLLAVCAMGMFFVPHRSFWLASFALMGFAGFYLWPGSHARKLLWGTATIAGILLLATVTIGVIDQVTGKDMTGWTIARLESLLPGDEFDDGPKAWDTRLPGAASELGHWAESPIVGGGFGVQVMDAIEGDMARGYQHMPWTSTLAQTGILGGAGFLILIVGMTLAGIRLTRSGGDKWTVYLGVIGAVWGLNSFMFGFLSLSWNTPRGGLVLGLLAGVTFRAAAVLQRREQHLLMEDPSYDPYYASGSLYGRS